MSWTNKNRDDQNSKIFKKQPKFQILKKNFPSLKLKKFLWQTATACHKWDFGQGPVELIKLVS